MGRAGISALTGSYQHLACEVALSVYYSYIAAISKVVIKYNLTFDSRTEYTVCASLLCEVSFKHEDCEQREQEVWEYRVKKCDSHNLENN